MIAQNNMNSNTARTSSVFTDVLKIKTIKDQRRPSDFTIGQKILEDLGINKVKKQGGNF